MAKEQCDDEANGKGEDCYREEDVFQANVPTMREGLEDVEDESHQAILRRPVPVSLPQRSAS